MEDLPPVGEAPMESYAAPMESYAAPMESYTAPPEPYEMPEMSPIYYTTRTKTNWLKISLISLVVVLIVVLIIWITWQATGSGKSKFANAQMQTPFGASAQQVSGLLVALSSRFPEANLGPLIDAVNTLIVDISPLADFAARGISYSAADIKTAESQIEKVILDYRNVALAFQQIDQSKLITSANAQTVYAMLNGVPLIKGKQASLLQVSSVLDSTCMLLAWLSKLITGLVSFNETAVQDAVGYSFNGQQSVKEGYAAAGQPWDSKLQGWSANSKLPDNQIVNLLKPSGIKYNNPLLASVPYSEPLIY